MFSQKTICYNSTRNHYSSDVITKVLKTESVSDANISNNNNISGISGSIINIDINFLICNSCYWCASVYSNMNNLANAKCPVCDDSSNLESIPISKKESFKINHNSKSGVVLEFSRKIVTHNKMGN
ncbi:MAG: hypothetical protein WBP64_03270 [Nitrososphaeraceae archaeon]